MAKYFHFSLFLVVSLSASFFVTSNIAYGGDYKNLLFSTLIALIITIGASWFWTFLYIKHPQKTLVFIHRRILGRHIGGFFSICYIGHLILLGLFNFSVVVEIAHDYLLPTTPLFFISFLLALVPLLVLKQSKHNYMQFHLFMFVIQVLILNIFFVFIYRGIEMTYLKGMLLHSRLAFDWGKFLVACLSFSAFPYWSYWNAETKAIPFKKTIWIYVVICVAGYLSYVMVPFGVWGPWATKKLNLIWILTGDTVGMDLFFIERGVYVVILLTMVTGSLFLCLNAHTVTGLFEKWFIKDKRKIFILMGVVYLAYILYATFVTDIQNIYLLATKFLWVYFILQYLWPIVLVLVYKLRGLK